ncbi:SemiSWEET transporter [Actinocorallia lasiicapitis]
MTQVGLLAGALTTGCWAPQLLRSWRTRSTDDFSWTYLALLTAGVGLWLAYGLGSGDLAITLANAVTFLALVTIAALKFQTVRTATAEARTQAVGASRDEAEIVAEPSTVSPS